MKLKLKYHLKTLRGIELFALISNLCIINLMTVSSLYFILAPFWTFETLRDFLGRKNLTLKFILCTSIVASLAADVCSIYNTDRTMENRPSSHSSVTILRGLQAYLLYLPHEIFPSLCYLFSRSKQEIQVIVIRNIYT